MHNSIVAMQKKCLFGLAASSHLPMSQTADFRNILPESPATIALMATIAGNQDFCQKYQRHPTKAFWPSPSPEPCQSKRNCSKNNFILQKTGELSQRKGVKVTIEKKEESVESDSEEMEEGKRKWNPYTEFLENIEDEGSEEEVILREPFQY